MRKEEYMKRALTNLVVFMLTAVMLLGAAACNTGGAAGSKPTVNVVQSALYCDLGESVTLPAATAEDERDGDISASVKVTVYQGETVALAESAGNVEQTFTPSTAGDYVARYVVKNSAGVSSDIKEVNISVGEIPAYTEGKPTISVDVSADSSTSSSVTLRAAAGATAGGEDISASVRVVLYDSKNVTKFEGAGNVAQKVDGLADGTYTVVYTLEHEGKSADAVQYILTVATGGDLKPFLSAPLNDVTVFAGESVAISTANASDLIDGDLSGKVKYRIEKADGTQVVAKTAATALSYYRFDEAGEYRVIYSVESERGKEADEAGFDVHVLTPKSGDIVLDGVIDEGVYLTVPAHRGGIGGNVLYRFYSDSEALYIGAAVSDYNLIGGDGADATTKLNLSDGLEFYFDPGDTNKDLITSTNSFRIRVGVDGTTASYVANTTNDQWKAGSFDLSDKVAVKTNGTLSVNGKTAADAAEFLDEDTGYTVEMKLPWSFFGYDGAPSKDAAYGKDYIRIGLGHRDVKHTQIRSGFYQMNDASAVQGANNAFYNGMNFGGRPKVATEGLHPGLYSYLYLTGDLLGLDPVSYEEDVVLDGFMENSFWADAQSIPFNTTSQGAAVTAKIKVTQSGVFAGVWIEDGQVVSDARSFLNNYGISCNDSIDIRFTVNDERTKNALIVSGDKRITDSKVVVLDASGAAYLQMLQPVGISRTLVQRPFAYGVAVNGTVGRSTYNDQWTNLNAFIADKNIGDIDNGWGIEIFMPWSTLNVTAPSEGDEVEIGCLLAIYDRGVDLTNAAWKYSLREQGGAGATPNIPNTYYMVTATV